MNSNKIQKSEQNICVCQGIRSCLLCEKNVYHKQLVKTRLSPFLKTYIFCNKCENKAFLEQFNDHCLHLDLIKSNNNNSFISIDGIFVAEEIITEEDEKELISKIDSIDWINSQSGRRKQDFGPKVNFKKQKIKLNQFLGLPKFDKQLLNRIITKLNNKCLNDFIAVEVCHLEYNPQNGSAIDLHFDDFWLWGERLVTINLLSTTILTLVLPQINDREADEQIHVYLPQRSLVILSGDSRYKYQHSIQRQHIKDRRIAITYRELTKQFLPEGHLHESVGKEILIRSNNEILL